MVQQWRKAMLARKGDKNLNENVNDRSLFNQVRVRVRLRLSPNPNPNPNPDPNPNPNQVRHLPAKARSNLDSLAHGLWLASRGPGRFVDNSFVDLTFE